MRDKRRPVPFRRALKATRIRPVSRLSRAARDRVRADSEVMESLPPSAIGHERSLDHGRNGRQLS
jgi:hypothetical protein